MKIPSKTLYTLYSLLFTSPTSSFNLKIEGSRAEAMVRSACNNFPGEDLSKCPMTDLLLFMQEHPDADMTDKNFYIIAYRSAMATLEDTPDAGATLPVGCEDNTYYYNWLGLPPPLNFPNCEVVHEKYQDLIRCSGPLQPPNKGASNSCKENPTAKHCRAI